MRLAELDRYFASLSLAEVEDILNRLGFVLVTTQTAAIVERVEAGLPVSGAELAAALYDFHSSDRGINMLSGRVKNWTERGFGFATPDDGGNDVFIHVSELPPGF